MPRSGSEALVSPTVRTRILHVSDLHFGRNDRPESIEALATADRGGRTGARDRERRPDAPRPAVAARAGGRVPPRPRVAAARDPGQPRHPVHVPEAIHEALARVRAAVGRDGARVPLGRAPRRRAELRAPLAAPVRPAPAAPDRTRPRAPRRCARPARCASSSSTTTCSGRPGGRARSRSPERNVVLAGLVDAGADLILAGHIHQSTIAERREFELSTPEGERAVVVSIAPGFGAAAAAPARRGARAARLRGRAGRPALAHLHLARGRVGAHGRAELPARP